MGICVSMNNFQFMSIFSILRDLDSVCVLLRLYSEFHFFIIEGKRKKNEPKYGGVRTMSSPLGDGLTPPYHGGGEECTVTRL